MFLRVLGFPCLIGGLIGVTQYVHAQEAALGECVIGGRSVKLVLTGSAVRTKHFLKIYAIDSYVEQGAKIRTAQEIIAADQAKQLRLVMLRTVDGPTMADAFVEIFRANHPEPAFSLELEVVAKILEGQTAHKGDTISFTHVPKVGFECKTSKGTIYLVRNVEFSKAVWGNYFGEHNVGERVKKDLLSRLPKE